MIGQKVLEEETLEDIFRTPEEADQSGGGPGGEPEGDVPGAGGGREDHLLQQRGHHQPCLGPGGYPGAGIV